MIDLGRESISGMLDGISQLADFPDSGVDRDILGQLKWGTELSDTILTPPNFPAEYKDCFQMLQVIRNPLGIMVNEYTFNEINLLSHTVQGTRNVVINHEGEPTLAIIPLPPRTLFPGAASNLFFLSALRAPLKRAKDS